MYDLRIVDDSGIRLLRRLTPAIISTLRGSLRRQSQETAREMKRQAPKASSLLTNSIKADQQNPLQWFVGPHVRYAVFVEKGRVPGGKMPPLQAIRDWVRMVLRPPVTEQRNVAFRVARKIRDQGIPPNRFAQRTYRTMEPRVQRQVAADIQTTIRRLGSQS